MKMMFTTRKDVTVSRFLKELKLVAEYFQWDEPSGTRECHIIRGHAKNRVFCPLAAVAYSLHGVNLGCDQVAKACEIIGLPLEAGMAVAKAADGGVAFDGELGYLHERLMRAVGL